jgi:phosphatidylglycerol:prolipoprotein diacylglycerol transferase
MSIIGPYVHQIDPIIGTLFGIHLWWYGLSYTIGFLNAHMFIKSRRSQLGLSMQSVYDLSLLVAVCIMLGGRFVEVVFYEWPFYREHFPLIPAYWLGGMSTHGLLFGGLMGIWAFSRLHGKPFLGVTDALAMPAAVIMGLGRIGNFIDGQIVGSVTTVWWAIKFPDTEGFRHPVVLYDGLKNLLIVPILISAGKQQLSQGVQTGIFLFLYAFLRLFVDLFRVYPTTLLGLATGQVLNILMSVLGLGLMFAPWWVSRGRAEAAVERTIKTQEDLKSGHLGCRRLTFSLLLLFSLVIPSDWTQDIPTRYRRRHPGLGYSAIYPRINASPEVDQPKSDATGTPDQLLQPTP